MGGLAAAAAHQLGSPLSTIAVIASELGRDIPADSDMYQDIKLLQSESDRCRDILASLSHSPKNADDNPFAEVPISVIAELAAMPHQQNDISVTIEKYPTLRNLDNHKDQALEPNVTRSPELLHGLSTCLLYTSPSPRD